VTLVNLTDAADLFASWAPTDSIDPRRIPDRNRRRRLQRALNRGQQRPILLTDAVRGERIVDAATTPIHVQRYYGVTTQAGLLRARPHRNPQGIKGGQRGNGAAHDGRVHGLTPTGKV